MVLRPPGSANISLTRVAHSNPGRHPPSRPLHSPPTHTERQMREITTSPLTNDSPYQVNATFCMPSREPRYRRSAGTVQRHCREGPCDRWEGSVSEPSRAVPAPGQMLAAGRKQGPALCCWIRLQGEACCAVYGAVESSEFSWKQKLRGWKIWGPPTSASERLRARAGRPDGARCAYGQAPVRPFSARCRV